VNSQASPTTPPVEQLIPGEGQLGCLLIHGLTGTPAEMFPVAAALGGRHPLWVTRVAGHAGDIEHLATSSWQDWYASAAAGADALAAVAPRIVAIGLSMGALLALRLAIERPRHVAGVVLLAPAIVVRNGLVQRLGPLLRILDAADQAVGGVRSALARVRFAKGASDIADAIVRASHPGYRAIPLRALMNLVALQRHAWRNAPTLTQPALVIHALQDHACPVDAARALFERLGSDRKRLVLLDESFHVITVDRERARVIAEIEAFVAEIAASADDGA
jgi:carboxylesterase